MTSTLMRNSVLAGLAVILSLLVIGILGAWKGRDLELFSSEYMSRSRLLHSPVLRLGFYLVVGLTWYASRFRLPGVEFVLGSAMDNWVGVALRAAYWKARLKHMGKNVKIDVGARFRNAHNISIGDASWIDAYVILIAGADKLDKRLQSIVRRENANYDMGEGEIHIGECCHIAANAIIQGLGGVKIGPYCGVAAGGKIYSGSQHIYNPRDPSDRSWYYFTPQAPSDRQLLILGPVVLEEGSGVGVNGVVLPGVTLHKHALVAANAVVTSDVPEGTVAAGPRAVTRGLRKE